MLMALPERIIGGMVETALQEVGGLAGDHSIGAAQRAAVQMYFAKVAAAVAG